MSWFCIKTVSHQETLAQLSLKRLGYAVFCPQLLVEVKQRANQPWRGLYRLVPMFSGYAFVRFDLSDPLWPQIIRSPGVSSVISMPAAGSPFPQPVALRDELVEVLRLVSQQATQPPGTPSQAVPVGVTVRITDGPLMDLSGIVTWSSEQRVVLLLSWMGGERTVEVRRKSVEIVE